jgi:hypothetical protein
MQIASDLSFVALHFLDFPPFFHSRLSCAEHPERFLPLSERHLKKLKQLTVCTLGAEQVGRQDCGGSVRRKMLCTETLLLASHW